MNDDNNTAVKTRFTSYQGIACPVEATLELLRGKGKGMIMFHLLEGTLRFNELKRMVGGISQRILTKQLRELEAHDLIKREVFPEVPPRVEYSLTETGKTLTPLILSLKDWGINHALPILRKEDE